MGNKPRVPTVPPPPGGSGGALIEAGDVFHIFHSVPLGQGKDFSTKKKKKKKKRPKLPSRVYTSLKCLSRSKLLILLEHLDQER